MKVSVVILNWNGLEMLRKYLPGVLAHSIGEGVEVVVADNGSDDGSLEMLRSDFPTVRLVVLDKNYGFAEGYNRALRGLESEYYVLLNSDVRTTDGWLRPLTAFMDAHPEVGACQPKIRSDREPQSFEYAGACGGFIDAYGYPFCRGRIFGTVERDKGQYDLQVPLLWASGAALFVRATVYWACGGLDATFFAHMEEIDFCWRMRKYGHAVMCVPSSVVFHWGGGTLSKSNPFKTYLNFRNSLYMLYKNLPDADLLRVMRMRRVLDYVAMLRFLLSFHWGDFAAVRRARRDFKANRRHYDACRREIARRTVVTHILERRDFSILFKYYILRKRCYSEL